jgi:hypothetical protein
MAQAFGQGISSDHGLRSRLSLPLHTSQMPIPGISTIAGEHQASPGSRVTTVYHSSQSRSVPSNYAPRSDVQQFPLPPQDQSLLQQAVVDLSIDSPPMYFNDYLKLHNQLATSLPLRPANDPIYASSHSHGVIDNRSASGYSTSAQQHYSRTRAWSDATSSHPSNPTTSMARDEHTGENWSYHPVSFPSEIHRQRGLHEDQRARGSSFHIHQSSSAPQQPEDSASTAPKHKHQTWEELAREIGFHE